MKKVKRVVLGEGYYDHKSGNEEIMLWKNPIDSDSSSRVRFPGYEKFDKKKIRLVAEIL